MIPLLNLKDQKKYLTKEKLIQKMQNNNNNNNIRNRRMENKEQWREEIAPRREEKSDR